MALATTLTTSQSSPKKVTSETILVTLDALIRAKVERAHTISAELKCFVLETGRTEESENQEVRALEGSFNRLRTSITHDSFSAVNKSGKSSSKSSGAYILPCTFWQFNATDTLTGIEHREGISEIERSFEKKNG